jgi:nucleotide-binding universal stress UspA family protein
MRAAEWAAREAVRRKTVLRIVSAPAPLPRMPSPYVREVTITEALRAVACQHLGRAVERAGEVAPGLEVETKSLSGPIEAAVADCGQSASVLVLGARGAGGFSAMALGSVSRYGAAHAQCPVVVVREETMAVQREVAVGIRDPEDAQPPLALAFEEAALRGADLLVVHAWYWIPPGLRAKVDPGYTPELISAAAGQQLEDMLSAWREKYPTVKVFPEVVHGHPAQVLASLSARADLTVIGKRTVPSLGSIRNVVLTHAHGPIAIVPGTQPEPARHPGSLWSGGDGAGGQGDDDADRGG